MTHDAPRTCPWCDNLFVPQSRRGPEKIFCSTAHQRKFWSTLRQWAFERFLVGEVSIADLHLVSRRANPRRRAIAVQRSNTSGAAFAQAPPSPDSSREAGRANDVSGKR